MTDVLDHGYVKLVETWGSDARIIEAARMSTSKGFLGWGPKVMGWPCLPNGERNGQPREELPDFLVEVWLKNGKPKNQDATNPYQDVREEPGDEKLLSYLWKNRHTTPFEQCGMSVEVQAPIMVFREWHRHRTQAYNEFSARYSQMPNLHYMPTLERIKLTSSTNKQAQGLVPLAGDDVVLKWLEEAKELQDLVYAHYERGLQSGISKEVARLNTPVSRYSKMVASANLLNWLRFLGLRQAEDAQWEIRQFANAVGNLIAEKFPRTWALAQEKKI